MEGLPTGDIHAKYQKLASEYSKLRVHVKVLKKGVLDEQAKCGELREALKEKEKSVRKGELEIDSLTFRNQQLTRRVAVLQDELDAVQSKQTKKVKSKTDEKQVQHATSSTAFDAGVLQDELQKKIFENAQLVSQLADRTFEVSQLTASLEECRQRLTDADSKHRCELARLNQKLQNALEGSSRMESHGPVAWNGDLPSHPASIGGCSEDAISTDGEGGKLALEQEMEKLKLEFDLLVLENESLKAEAGRGGPRGPDSGDFGDAVGGEGLLGALHSPIHLSREVTAREDRLQQYFRNKLSQLAAEKDELKGKADHYLQECESLRARYAECEEEKNEESRALQQQHDTIKRLEEELSATSHHYERQMSLLTEHVADLAEQLQRQRK